MKNGTGTNVLALPFIIKTLYNNTPVKKAANFSYVTYRHSQLADIELDLV
jgi:hypothetical protein